MNTVSDYWSGWALVPPGDRPVSGDAARAYARRRQQYRSRLECLENLAALHPELAFGNRDVTLDDHQVTQIFSDLTGNASYHEKKLIHNFLVKGMERGCAELGWKLRPYAPLISISYSSPLVVKEDFKRLHQLDELLDQHRAVGLLDENTGRHDAKWAAGRFLFSLITDGSLLRKSLISKIPEVFESGVGLDRHHPYLTIRDDVADAAKKPPRATPKEQTEEEHPQSKSEADDDDAADTLDTDSHIHYRRIFIGPVTSLLLLSYYRQHGQVWPKDDITQELASVDACLWHYCETISENLKLPKSLLSFLIDSAWTDARLFFSPFCAFYASQDMYGLSLPPSSWQRLITNKISLSDTSCLDEVPQTISLLGTESLPEAPHRTNQMKRYNVLTSLLPSSQKGRSFTRQQVKSSLDNFIQSSSGDSPILQLLARWARHLLHQGTKFKSRLEVSTVHTYLTRIGSDLISVASSYTGLSDWTSADWELLYDNVLLRSKTSDQRSLKLTQLTSFHAFLERYYEVPAVNLERGKGVIRRVDANVLTPAEFMRARHLIRSSTESPRLRLIQELVLIIGYRCGLRRSEVASLQLRDLHGVEDPTILAPELLVRRNRHAGVKTGSSTRRLPLHLLLMPDERQLLARWKIMRHAETSGGNDLQHLLFCLPGLPREMIRDNMLFRPIHHAMRLASGEPVMRFHHLRHSFVTITLIRLTERTPGSLFPRHWVTDDHGKIAVPHWNEDLSALANLAPRGAVDANRLWCVSLWAGHLTPSETLASYAHLLDLQLREEVWSARDLEMSVPLQASLMGRSTNAVSVWRHKWRQRTGLDTLMASHLCEALVQEWQPFHEGFDDTHWQAYSPPEVPPAALSPYQHLSASGVYSALHYIEVKLANDCPWQETISLAANRLQLPHEVLSDWVQEGRRLMELKTARGKPRFSRLKRLSEGPKTAEELSALPMPELSCCLAPPTWPSHQKEANRLFSELLAWHTEAPEDFDGAVTPIIKTMQRADAQLKFREDEDLISAVPLFRRLGLMKHLRLKLEVATEEAEKAAVAYWKKRLTLPGRSIHCTVRKNGQPTRHEHGNANLLLAEWNKPLGDKDHDYRLWTALRFALFTALVVIQPHRQDNALRRAYQ